MFEARHAWEQIYRQEGLTLDDPFLRFPELVEEFREHKCERILDLGCGSGRHVLALARNGFEVVGLDAAPTGISLAKACIAGQGDHAQLVLGDLSYPLPFRSESFDGLMATQVIHHALQEHIRKTIAEICRVLKRGGIAFITAPARPDADMIFDEIAPNTLVPRSGAEAGVPHYYFTLEEFGAVFAGFDILELSVRGDNIVFAFMGRKR